MQEKHLLVDDEKLKSVKKTNKPRFKINPGRRQVRCKRRVQLLIPQDNSTGAYRGNSVPEKPRGARPEPRNRSGHREDHEEPEVVGAREASRGGAGVVDEFPASAGADPEQD